MADARYATRAELDREVDKLQNELHMHYMTQAQLYRLLLGAVAGAGSILLSGVAAAAAGLIVSGG